MRSWTSLWGPALVLVCCGVLAADEATLTNLLPNGGFEATPAGPETRGKAPEGWRFYFGRRGVLEIIASTRPGSKGKQCLKINTGEKLNSGGVRSELTPLDPTKVLLVSGWMKGGGVLKRPQGAYFGVAWYDARKRPISIRKGTTLNYTYLGSGYKTPKWIKLKRVFMPCFDGPKETYKGDEIPPNAAFFDVRIFSLEFPKPAYFDDIFATQDIAKSDWLVGWEGSRDAVRAAKDMAALLTRVLGKEIAAAPWRGYDAKHTLVVTDRKHAPADAVKLLAGKRLDAFAILYPYRLHDREVCLLVANSATACDLPVNYFLRTYMGVEWVGPSAIGEIVPEQPGFKMPAKIEVVENPDYEHRFWNERQMNLRRWLAGSFRLQFHHNQYNVFDPKKYHTQPNLYPFYNGKRNVPDPKVRAQRVSGWQACVSHPKAVEIAAQYGLDYLAKRPDVRSFSLSVNDGGKGICLCEGCRAMDAKRSMDSGQFFATDRFFKFNNQVIERVLKKNPNAYVAALGYGRCKQPPAETKIHPRVLVFNVCGNTNPQPDMAQRQRDWKAAGAQPCIYQWLWDAGFLTVRHYPHALRDIVKLSHDLGGFGYYCESITNFAAGGPKFYVLSHVLWDTGADVDALLDRYMTLAFGPEAAPHMRAWFDRWEQVWERGGKAVRYNTGRNWRSVKQLEMLTRADLKALDAALAKARRAQATKEQKVRLGYVNTYYQWLRINADQYLVARELAEPQGRENRTAGRMLREIERGMGLTAKFDAMWKKTISRDRSGWLLSWRYQQRTDLLWKTLIAPIRNGVLGLYEPAIDAAFDRITAGMVRRGRKSAARAFWKRQLPRHPKLAKWIRTQMWLLTHKPGTNLVANGGFERGLAGSPPKIESWSSGGNWQGIMADFAWREGREGGHAAVIGRGYAATFTGGAATKAGHRYRITLWVKTSGPRTRVSGTVGAAPLPLVPTDGAWREFTTTFTATRNGTPIRLNSYGQDKGQWTWFDDVAVVEICGK